MVNELINRNSVRNYKQQPIEKEKIIKLKEVINASPTTMNFQSFSAIFITSQIIKNELMKLNWDQLHVGQAPLIIVFVADLNRLKISIDAQQKRTTTKEWDSYIMATIDATIAATSAMVAALDLGLSTCFLGGLRWNHDAANKILNVQGSASVVLGLTVGYELGKSVHRPKINKVYDESYDLTKIKDEVASYDVIMKDYYKDVFNKDTNFTKVSIDALTKIDATHSASISNKKFKI